jgi:acetolactate synthase-1/2/3 large subunit
MKIKVSDYVIQLLEEKGVDTAFCITGGAAAHLMESLRTSEITVYHNYHEQACAMSADGYARIAKKPAMVLVTNGPGSSNAITGVLGAWQDSVPMIVLSGQVPRNQTLSAESRPLRQLGLQEADVISMVQHCTNYATQLTSSAHIKYKVDQAWHKATSGRMGPVWLDIPIDLQSEIIETDDQIEFHAEEVLTQLDKPLVPGLIEAVLAAKKPLIVAGNGVHLANAESEFIDLVNTLKIPVVCTWNAKDLFNYNNDLYVGNFGLLGERAANFAIQEADLLIIIGSRLSIPVTGYNTKDFANNSVKIMVDLDVNEMLKHTLTIDYPVVDDIKNFIPKIKNIKNTARTEWTATVNKWKQRFDLFNEKHIRHYDYVNSFDFMKEFSQCLRPNDVVVTDMGTSFTCTMQALRHTGNDRLFTSSALCSMGFGLPGAIGAYTANTDNRVICIAGDGGFQMNIQELQTIVQYRLPVKIIVLNNAGYLAISLMQDNLFDGKHFGADKESGVSNPDFVEVAKAYGIPAYDMRDGASVKFTLRSLLSQPGPALIEVNMVRNQLLIPRVQSKRDSQGKIISGSLDAMFPFLPDEQVEQVRLESQNCGTQTVN